MKTYDENLEARVQSVLHDYAPDLAQETEEQGYFELAASIFKGRLGWVAWLVLVAQIIMFVVAFYAAAKFFSATDVLTALKWGLPSVALLMFAAQMKLSLMPWLQTQRVLRALNRVELLLLSKSKGS